MHTTVHSITAQRTMAPVVGLAHARQLDAEDGMAAERLPFTVRRVATTADLMKAVQIRHAAYARHVPEFAATLVHPEAADLDPDTVVLLAESKLDGSPLGSIRIQSNRTQPLKLEESVELPAWLRSRRLVEVTRLGIEEGRVGKLVKLALMKGCFQYCEENAFDYLVVTARTPIDRQYEQLLFSDVFPGQPFVPLSHVGNMPHRIMASEIATAEQRWEAVQHPLLKFFRHTRHADIDVSAKPARHHGAVDTAWMPAAVQRPRSFNS